LRQAVLNDFMLEKAEIMGISDYIKILIKNDMEKNKNE